MKMIVSEMAEGLIGSEIIKLAAEITEKIKAGEKIYNFTIGDFDPDVFPIPAKLEEEIIKAYKEKNTNYPSANGISELRKSIAHFLSKRALLDYTPDEILVTSGARPAIYATYVTLLNKGDKVIYPVPSWNNNHYCHLVGAEGVQIETSAKNNFMPTAAEIAPHIAAATMISLCSPLNPTGTSFSKKALYDICCLIVEENNRRKAQNRKPLYLMYDQIYWVLTYGETEHYNPVTLHPGMRDYTIFIDGLSKSFAATGIRVGWTFGPRYIIDKMKAILSHIGAWAPKAEQVASAKYLMMDDDIDKYLLHFKNEIELRLVGFYNGIQELKQEGFKVDAINPQSAIYLTVQFDLAGKQKANGEKLQNTTEVTQYLLEEAQLAIVPFFAFGAATDSTWFRWSVGTCKSEEIEEAIHKLRMALRKLS